MGYYTVGGNQGTVTTSYKGAVATWTATATAARRIKWYEYILGATGVPNATDCPVQWDISRLAATTSIAGTSFTPNPVDSADAAALAVALTNITTEPASALISNSLANAGLNQRNTLRWVAAQEAQFLIAPATNLNGLYLRVLSPNYGSSFAAQISYLE